MNCPVCDSKTRHFTDQKLYIKYHHCPDCDYIFKDPAHHKSFDEQKKRYDLHENDPDDQGYGAYFQRFLDFVLPFVGVGGGRVLDFGSGASDLLGQMLSVHGYKAQIYDPIYHPDNSYIYKKYDLIVSTEVFEHLADPLETMRHLAGLLSVDGYLAIQTQFHPKDQEEFLEWYYRLDPTHIGFFAPRTFRRIAQVCDLVYIVDDNANKVILQNQ